MGAHSKRTTQRRTLRMAAAAVAGAAVLAVPAVASAGNWPRFGVPLDNYTNITEFFDECADRGGHVTDEWFTVDLECRGDSRNFWDVVTLGDVWFTYTGHDFRVVDGVVVPGGNGGGSW